MTASFQVFPTFFTFFVCSSLLYTLPYIVFPSFNPFCKLIGFLLLFLSTFLFTLKRRSSLLSFLSHFFFFTLYEPGVSSLDPFPFLL